MSLNDAETHIRNINAIMDESPYIKELMAEKQLNDVMKYQGYIRWDHHSICMVLFSILPFTALGGSILLFLTYLITGHYVNLFYNIYYYSTIGLIVTYILYQVIQFIIDGNPFEASAKRTRLLEELKRDLMKI